MSTKAPKAATLVTVPSSNIPGLRSARVLTPSAKVAVLNSGPGIAGWLFQLGQDVAHRGQAEALIHKGGGVEAFERGAVAP